MFAGVTDACDRLKGRNSRPFLHHSFEARLLNLGGLGAPFWYPRAPFWYLFGGLGPPRGPLWPLCGNLPKIGVIFP